MGGEGGGGGGFTPNMGSTSPRHVSTPPRHIDNSVSVYLFLEFEPQLGNSELFKDQRKTELLEFFLLAKNN